MGRRGLEGGAGGREQRGDGAAVGFIHLRLLFASHTHWSSCVSHILDDIGKN
jgi:hypothetical protein